MPRVVDMAERDTAPERGVLPKPEPPIRETVSTTTSETDPADVRSIGDAAPGDAATSDAATGDARAANATARTGGPAHRRRQLALLGAVAALAFAADLITKLVVVHQLSDRAPIQVLPRVLDLQLTRNSGAAFGLAGGMTILFTLVAVSVVVFIIVTARRLRSRAWAVSLGLLLGGALGNLADRLFREPGFLRGHVVDWIHLTHWPIFNLADSAIVLGGLVAVLLSARGTPLEGGSRTTAAT
jgi:signal peptidase II